MSDERQRAALLQLRLGVMVQASGNGFAIVDYDALEKLATRNEDLLGSILVLRASDENNLHYRTKYRDALLERSKELTLARRRIADLEKALARAAYVAEHLHQMVPQEEWRAHGAEYMGQYEGDYHAEQVAREIREWKELAG